MANSSDSSKFSELCALTDRLMATGKYQARPEALDAAKRLRPDLTGAGESTQSGVDTNALMREIERIGARVRAK